MSIGIIAMGLLGVVALIPIAGFQAREGMRNERIAAAGRHAFREIEVQRLLDPYKWQAYFPSGLLPPKNDASLYMERFWPANLGNAPWHVPRPMLLDPRGYFLPGPNGEFPSPRDRGQMNLLPGTSYVPAGAPLLRISSWAFANIIAADEGFIAPDDLQFEAPKRSSQPTRQVSLRASVPRAGSAPIVAQKRHAAGEFSWMAMLVPVNQTPLPLNTAAPAMSEPYLGPYTVHAIVMEGRNRFEPETSRPAEIDVFGTIVTIPGQLPKSFRKGSWILVGAAIPQVHFSGVPYAKSQYRWYQAMSLSEEPNPNNSGVVTRVSVRGPEWKLASTARIGTQTVSVNTFAILIPKVVGVYTKTMSLQMSTSELRKPVSGPGVGGGLR